MFVILNSLCKTRNRLLNNIGINISLSIKSRDDIEITNEIDQNKYDQNSKISQAYSEIQSADSVCSIDFTYLLKNYKKFIKKLYIKPKDQTCKEFILNSSQKDADKIFNQIREGEIDIGQNNDFMIISPFTTCVIGGRILPLLKKGEDVLVHIKYLSSRRHAVYTGLSLIIYKNGKIFRANRLVKNIVKFRYIKDKTIINYVVSDKWKNTRLGYDVENIGESFIEFSSGVFSNLLGLPLSNLTKIVENYMTL